MPSIEEAFYQFVTTDSALKAVFGDRWADTELPPETLCPCGTFQLIHDEDRTWSGGTVPSHPVGIQVDTYFDDAGARREGRLVLDAAMRRFSGTWGGLRVNRALRDGAPYNTLEPAFDGSANEIHRSSSRWTIHVSEAGVATP